MVVLVGSFLVHVLGADFLAEGEVAVGDVDVVVVVDCGGADVLVWLAFDVLGPAAIRGGFGGEVDVGKLDDDLWDLVRGVWMRWKVGVSIEWIRTCRPLSADFSRRLTFMWTDLGEYSPASGLMRIRLAQYYYLGISICIMTGVQYNTA